MKKIQLSTFGKSLLLLILITLFSAPFVRSQSLNTSYDTNNDGVSDDFSHQSLIQNSDAYFSIKDTGDVVSYIPTPSLYCQGLTWDGTYLWCSVIIWGMIYQLDPLDGTEINSFSAPGNSVEGMAWDGTYLWAVDNDGGPYYSNVVYKINPDDGSVINSFEINDVVWIHGLTWDGQYLWMIDFDTDLIHKVDPVTGDILHTINSPGEKCIGLTWAGNHLWTDDFDTDKLYCLDPVDGSVIYDVQSPHTNPRDLAWDGQYLWVMASASSTIYQVDIGYVTSIDDFEFLLDNTVSMAVYPNPVFDKLNIEFVLDKKSKVLIEIYNQQGALVCCLVNQEFLPGKQMVTWNKKSVSNLKLKNGIYYCVLNSESEITSRKFIILQ